jgi:hypothetical protein
VKNSFFILIVGLMVGIFGFMCYEAFHKEYVTIKCPDCDGTGKLSCGAQDCVHGTIPCPNPECLALTRGVWVLMHAPTHHPDTYVRWFDLPNGDREMFTQGHVGHIIQLVDGHWKDVGPCPACHGKGRAECPACHGNLVCPTCHGKGKIDKEVQS